MLYKIISSSLILYDCFCLVVRLFVLLFDYLINVLNKKKKKKEMGGVLEITAKRMVPCWCLDGHVTKPYKMSMA